MITARQSWLLPATGIVAVEYSAALTIGWLSGAHYMIPLGTYVITALTIVALSLLVLVGIRLVRAASKGDEPLSLGRFCFFGAGVILVGLQIAVLNWLKVEMPLAVGFTADAFLARADALLFGVDPWRISHALLGWATPLIDRVYVTWGAAKFATIFTVLALPDSYLRSRCLIAYFLIAAGGSLGQYIAPSAGPVFYELLGLGDRFRELPVAQWMNVTRSYLWADYLRSGGRVGSGISAFPSLHVAMAAWIALVLRAYLPRWQLVGWVYFAFIIVGSVHLGWHYFLDGVAGAMLAALAWFFANELVAARRVPLARAVSGSMPTRVLTGGDTA